MGSKRINNISPLIGEQNHLAGVILLAEKAMSGEDTYSEIYIRLSEALKIRLNGNKNKSYKAPVFDKIEIGSLFLIRYDGTYVNTKVVVIYHKKEGRRVLWDIEYKRRIGEWHLLDSTYIGKLKKREIKKYVKLLNK